MLNLILVVMLTLLLFFVYIAHGRNFVNASFFMVAGFLLSSIFSLVSLEEWGASVGWKTVFVILSGVILFFVGDYLGYHTNNKFFIKKRVYDRAQITTDYLNVTISFTLIASLFMIIIDYLYFRFIYNLSLMRGNRLGIFGMFQYARYLIVDGTYDTSLPTLLGHGVIICECVGYIYLYIVIFNFIGRRKLFSANLIPCALYIVNAAISTARFNFLKYFVAGVFLALIILIKKNVYFRRIHFRTFAIAAIGFVAFIWAFRMLGYLTGKSAVRSLLSDVSVYIGSSIPALDNYLTTPQTPNEIFGKETLVNVYTILRKLQMTSVPAYSVPLPFIKFSNGQSTNIYTAFRRLIQDYSYFGMYFIIFMEGLFYGTFTKKIMNREEIGIETIIFAYMMYPVVFSCIEEKFVVNFTAVNLVYHIVYFCIMYKLILKTPNIMLGEGN